jgi:hypothetical protein
MDEIDDLEDVIAYHEPSDDDEGRIAVTVPGIQQLESVYSCLNYISATSGSEVVCDFCHTTQKITTKKYIDA